MLTPEQLESVRNVINICKRDHEREVCELLNRISDYEPQSRVAPSQFIEGYISQLFSVLSNYKDNLKDETIRVTRIVCPVLTEVEKERILEVAGTALAEEFYIKRFNIVCESIVRHFSRFGINIKLSDYRVDLMESRHTVGIKNMLREIKQVINTELSLLVSSAPMSAPEIEKRWWNEFLELKPNFFGLGININNLISKFRGRKN